MPSHMIDAFYIDIKMWIIIIGQNEVWQKLYVQILYYLKNPFSSSQMYFMIKIDTSSLVFYDWMCWQIRRLARLHRRRYLDTLA